MNHLYFWQCSILPKNSRVALAIAWESRRVFLVAGSLLDFVRKQAFYKRWRMGTGKVLAALLETILDVANESKDESVMGAEGNDHFSTWNYIDFVSD